jgi:hypothetical protein
MRHLRRLFEGKILFVVALISLLTSSLVQRYLGSHQTTNTDIDFYVYFFAAQTVHDNPHANLYEGATDTNPQLRVAPVDSPLALHAKAAGFDIVGFYVYPPLLADLLAPFSQIPAHLAATLWRIFNLVLVFASVLLLARMLRVTILSFEFVVLAMAAFSFFPINETIFIGQITVVMLALWTLGIVAYFDNRIILSAAAFALATAFKITPILLLPLFFIWKDRRWIVSYLAISLGLVSVMAAINGFPTVSVYPKVISAMGSGTLCGFNRTLGSLVEWIHYGKLFSYESALEVMGKPVHGLSIVEKIVSVAFYLTCIFLAWRNRRQLDRASRAATIAVFALAVACIAPVSYRHAYTVAFIVIAIFWVRALRTPTRSLHVALLAVTTFTLGTPFFDLAAEVSLSQFCKILFSSSWVIVSVLFCLNALFRAISDGDGSMAVTMHRRVNISGGTSCVNIP